MSEHRVDSHREHRGLTACCGSWAAICYWFAISLIAWAILGLVGAYWRPLRAGSPQTILLAMAIGCFANWGEDARRQHYKNLCALDGRIALAGEHASYLPAWQEGAILSALDAITRLHQRAVTH